MSDKKLDSLFERLLGEPEDVSSSLDPTDIAALAAALDAEQGPAAPPAMSGDPTALLAAYLDGGLDERQRQAFEANLAAAPAELHEAQASLAFAAAVAAERATAPRSLVATALTMLPEAPKAKPRQRSSFFAGFVSARSWQWSALAAAAAVVVVAVGTYRLEETRQPAVATAPPTQNAPTFATGTANTVPTSDHVSKDCPSLDPKAPAASGTDPCPPSKTNDHADPSGAGQK